jgi:transcriptional regulator with XRE-family HTH domain
MGLLKKENYPSGYWSTPMETEYLSKPMQGESSSTSSVSDQLLENFKGSREYRHAFVEEKTRTSIAAQIKAIRERHRLKQPEFAKALSKSQSWVSRLEDPNQPAPTIPSLLAVAEAFDVDLEIRFGKFSELLGRLEALTPEALEVPSFEEELKSGAFKKAEVFDWIGACAWSPVTLSELNAAYTDADWANAMNAFALPTPTQSKVVDIDVARHLYNFTEAGRKPMELAEIDHDFYAQRA